MNIEIMSELFATHLSDESRLTGSCQTFSIPSSVDELQVTARSMWEKGIPVTVQGALTGICGCAVPSGGHVISTEKLNRIIGHRKDGNKYYVNLEPGVRLSELLSYCRRNYTELSGHTFLPNPTEKLASFGGMFSCNAKGQNSFLHGDTVAAVNALKMLVPNGTSIEIRRGECVFDEHGCDVPELGRLEIEKLPQSGCGAKGMVFAHSGSDLIDVIGGSEGMLAIVTQLELELEKPAAELWGIMFFFDCKQAALDFAERTREHFKDEAAGAVRLAAAEYLDATSIALVNEYKKQVTLLTALPDFPPNAQGAVYLELEGSSAGETEAKLEGLLELFTSCGGEEADTWAASSEEEIDKFRLLRHAVPEAVNFELDKARQLDSRINKLCTDFEIPSLRISEAEEIYSSLLTENGLKGAVFGHTYSKRLHFNIVPQNYTEYENGKRLLVELIDKLAAADSCITWENGIGKTKKALLRLLPDERLITAKAIKNFFDKKTLLNPDNML